MIIQSLEVLSLSLHISLHYLSAIFPIFFSFNNKIPLYCAVCSLCLSIFLIYAETLVSHPRCTDDYDSATLDQSCSISDPVIIVLLYVYCSMLVIKAWQLAPGFMIGQTCFVLCLEIMLLELLI